MSKKGLSDVVTGVLLVFIILIALGIIWLFIKPFVEETSTVASAKDCILLETSPVQCTYSDGRADISEPQKWFVTVRARRGPDNAINVTEIKLVFSNKSYTPASKTTSWNLQQAGQTVPNPYETTEAGFNLGNFVPGTVAVAPFVNKDKRACNLSPELPCTRYQYTPHTGCIDVDESDFPNGDDFDIFVLCYTNISRNLPCIGRYNSANGQHDLPITPKRFDITRDGNVNLDDYSAFYEAWIAGDNFNCPA